MSVLTGSACLKGELFYTPRLTANQRPIRSHWETPILYDRVASPLLSWLADGIVSAADNLTAFSTHSSGKSCGEPRAADHRSTHETPTHGGRKASHHTGESTRIQAMPFQDHQSTVRNFPDFEPVGLGPTHTQTGGKKGRAPPINFAIDGNGANRRDRRLHSNLISVKVPASVRTHPLFTLLSMLVPATSLDC